MRVMGPYHESLGMFQLQPRAAVSSLGLRIEDCNGSPGRATVCASESQFIPGLSVRSKHSYLEQNFFEQLEPFPGQVRGHLR
jgi:hypothetical protein